MKYAPYIFVVFIQTVIYANVCTTNDCGINGVVRIENRVFSKTRNQYQSDFGSGTLLEPFLGKRVVVTAAHIFKDGIGEIFVIDIYRNSIKCKLLSKDNVWDIAILVPNSDLKITPIILAEKHALKGDAVCAYGYGPLGQLKSFPARVLGYTQIDKSSSYETLKISNAVRQGDSGGPILNANNELVAVLWGTDGQATYSTYVGRVKAFMTSSIPPPEKIEAPKTVIKDEAPKIQQPNDAIIPAQFDSYLLTALGISSPLSVALYYIAKLLLKRRIKQKINVNRSQLNNGYAEELNSVYELSGRSSVSDATLGRLYEQKVSAAEQSTNADIARYAKQLRKEIADQFFRIHSTHPSPNEPVDI